MSLEKASLSVTKHMKNMGSHNTDHKLLNVCFSFLSVYMT
jgi:hypothetical protein